MKEELLEHAMAIALKEGVSAVTLDRVAESAGVTKGGLLYHFRSKNELFREISRMGYDRYWFRIQEKQEQGAELWEAMLDFAIEFRAQIGPVYALLLQSCISDPKALETNRKGQLDLLHQLEKSGLSKQQAFAFKVFVDGIVASASMGLPALSEEQQASLQRAARQIVGKSCC
jgi:AcrR family transcriptional regulator